MSDLRPKYTTITLGGKEYGLLFNLNAIDAIQDRFDINISEFGELLADERKVFKALKAIIAILANEAIDDAEADEKHITEDFVGRKITVNDIVALKGSVFSAFTSGMPERNEEDDADPTKGEQ